MLAVLQVEGLLSCTPQSTRCWTDKWRSRLPASLPAHVPAALVARSKVVKVRRLFRQVMMPHSSNAASDLDANVVAVQREV